MISRTKTNIKMNSDKTGNHICSARRPRRDSVCWILLALVFALLCLKPQAARSLGYALGSEDGFNGSTLNQCNGTIGLRDPGKAADDVLRGRFPLGGRLDRFFCVTFNQQ